MRTTLREAYDKINSGAWEMLSDCMVASFPAGVCYMVVKDDDGTLLRASYSMDVDSTDMSQEMDWVEAETYTVTKWRDKA